jgi:uncharacterized protein (TIGR02996 family)
LLQLAERPFDRSLRLVFADWLLEQGDPRGEVIALTSRGELSLTERRRVARLTEQHAAQWLGPLAAVADVATTRFEGGFLSTLVCRAPEREAVWSELAGDPRLASVTNLVLPTGREATGLQSFLEHPVLGHLKRLQAPAIVWSQLRRAPPRSFALEVAAVASWGVFSGELAPVLQVPTALAAKRLELVTSEFVNPLVSAEIRRALAQDPASATEAAHGLSSELKPFDDLRLVARFGVVEGAVAWLLVGAVDVGVQRWAGSRWSIEFGDGRFSVERQGERFSHLVIDLSHDDDAQGLGHRIATAASVLVQLSPAALESVEVVLPAHARLRPGERDALRAATRRLRTVKRFSLGGVELTP